MYWFVLTVFFLWNIVLWWPYSVRLWHMVGSKRHLSQRGNFFRNEVLRCVSGHDCGLSLDASLLFKQLFIFNWDCLFWWNIDGEAQVATFETVATGLIYVIISLLTLYSSKMRKRDPVLLAELTIIDLHYSTIVLPHVSQIT